MNGTSMSACRIRMTWRSESGPWRRTSVAKNRLSLYSGGQVLQSCRIEPEPTMCRRSNALMVGHDPPMSALIALGTLRRAPYDEQDLAFRRGHRIGGAAWRCWRLGSVLTRD